MKNNCDSEAPETVFSQKVLRESMQNLSDCTREQIAMLSDAVNEMIHGIK
ncbi:MAG: hypothetical protein LBT64_01055 [Puniceicoccales bacterium]|nr:hypothetical protein [Puniceicoccales bacterium]